MEEEVQLMLVNNRDFHMTRGNKVLEIRPSIQWNKGDALKYLLDSLGFQKSDDVFPIYIGDDRTDEDAFKVYYLYTYILFTILLLIRVSKTKLNNTVRVIDVYRFDFCFERVKELF